MSTTSDLERQVRVVLETGAPSAPPDELLGRVLASTGRSRPRPAWLADLKEPPMRHSSRVTVGSPTLRLIAIMALTLTLALAAAGAVVAGASMLPGPPVPDPYGLARNGSMVFAQDGAIMLAGPAGDDARQILAGPWPLDGPSFSRDGTHMIFATISEGDGDDSAVALTLADADGRHARDFLPQAPDYWDFMPSGDAIVTTRVVAGETLLSLVSLPDGAISTIDTQGIQPTGWVGPRPPYGDEILFVGRPEPGSTSLGLYRIRPDGTGLRTIGALASDLTVEAQAAAPRLAFLDPEIAPDGGSIAWWDFLPTDRSDPSVPVIRSRAIETGADLEIPALGGLADPYVPVYAPDGDRLLVRLREAAYPKPQRLYVVPVSGSGDIQEVGDGWPDQAALAAAFSPDGSLVIVTADGATSTVDLASGAVTELPDITSQPSWQRLARQ